MPNMTKREIKKIQARLEFLYERLGGEKKSQPAPNTDEFTNIQTKISQEIIEAKRLIRDKEGLDKKTENFIELTKIKGQIKGKFIDLDDLMKQMKQLNADKATLKVSESQRSQRETIIAKLENIIDNLKYAFDPSSVNPNQFEPLPSNRIALKDLKSFKNDPKSEFVAPETDNEEREIMDRWRQKDKQLDDKLDDVNVLLEKLKEQSKKVSDEIDKRDVLVNTANKGATKVNAVLEEENHKLAKVLKEYRSPQKLCFDICLVLLLLGLIAVIVMLVKNGK